MSTKTKELQRLIRQQKRDIESDGTGRGWSKPKTYSVDFYYIENGNNLNPFQEEVKKRLVAWQDEDIRCQANLKLILRKLSKRERFIINQKLKGYTLEEIAEELDTYKMDICRTLNRLRPYFGLERRR